MDFQAHDERCDISEMLNLWKCDIFHWFFFWKAKHIFHWFKWIGCIVLYDT